MIRKAFENYGGGSLQRWLPSLVCISMAVLHGACFGGDAAFHLTIGERFFNSLDFHDFSPDFSGSCRYELEGM